MAIDLFTVECKSLGIPDKTVCFNEFPKWTQADTTSTLYKIKYDIFLQMWMHTYYLWAIVHRFKIRKLWIWKVQKLDFLSVYSSLSLKLLMHKNMIDSLAYN